LVETVRLPRADGTAYDYRPAGEFFYAEGGSAPQSRIAYAATHVVADALGAIDWERTLAFRRHIWGYGLGVAEAMDTAQRGMGLDWDASAELIRLSVAEARAAKGRIVCGANTDQLAPGSAHELRDIEVAYEEQCELIESLGGQVVVMASRELARIARGPDDYVRVYNRVLSQLRRPAIVHWLGEMFDPALAGYWGQADADPAEEVCLVIIAAHRDKVEGVKVSLLDQKREIAMRKRLPQGVHMSPVTTSTTRPPSRAMGSATATRCSALSTRSLLRLQPPCWHSTQATSRVSAPSWNRLLTSRGTSLPRRRLTTRQVSSSWPT
jgi:hypothetical protein